MGGSEGDLLAEEPIAEREHLLAGLTTTGPLLQQWAQPRMRVRVQGDTVVEDARLGGRAELAGRKQRATWRKAGPMFVWAGMMLFVVRSRSSPGRK